MGKAKDKIAREEAKRAEACEDFTRLLRHTKSLKLDSSWEDVKPDLESHSAYKDVRHMHASATHLTSTILCASSRLLLD